MALSAYAAQLALRFLLQGDDASRPSAWGIGLAAAPPDDTSFTEPVGGGYQRQTVSFSNPASDDLITADSGHTFAVSPSQTFYGFGLFDNTSGGSVLFYDTFDHPLVRGQMTGAPMVLSFGIAEGRNNLSQYACNLLLDYVARGVGAAPSVCAVGLSSDAPIPASNDARELVDAGYTRQVVALSPGPDGTHTNAAPFTYGPFSNDVVVAGANIFDATTGGSLLFAGVLGEAMSYAAGESMTFAPGHLLVSLV